MCGRVADYDVIKAVASCVKRLKVHCLVDKECCRRLYGGTNRGMYHMILLILLHVLNRNVV